MNAIFPRIHIGPIVAHHPNELCVQANGMERIKIVGVKRIFIDKMNRIFGGGELIHKGTIRVYNQFLIRFNLSI